MSEIEATAREAPQQQDREEREDDEEETMTMLAAFQSVQDDFAPGQH